MDPVEGDITVLLRRWKDGEKAAFDELAPLVYPQLRKIAASYLYRERNPDILQATVLVNELFLRLLKQRKAGWDDRAHFYTFCARLMRMILIDQARERLSQMRGAGAHRIPLSDDLAWVTVDSPELLDLNRALDELNEFDPEMVRLVELRYFLGFTSEETAVLKQVSKATVDRELKFIKSWLYLRIHPGATASQVEG
jgi:RNA polymerase sigma factor (TIGR02999 family)